jgi:hypothetical protein
MNEEMRAMKGKKLFYLIIVGLVASGLFGCNLASQSKSSKALESGKELMAEKDYAKAAEELKAAVEADGNNEPAKALLKIIEDYQKAKALYDKGSFEEAKKVLDGIDQKYREYAIAEDIDALKKSATETIAKSTVFNEKVAAVKEFLNVQRYGDAQAVLDELMNMNLTDGQKEIVDALQAKKDAEKAALEAKDAEEAAAAAAAEAAKKKQEDTKKQEEEEPYYGPSDVYDPYYDDYYYDPYYDDYYYGPSDVYDPYYDPYSDPYYEDPLYDYYYDPYTDSYYSY